MKKKEIHLGTIRIKISDLNPYKYTKNGWIKRISLKKDLENTYKVIDLFKAHNNFNILIDSKNPNFLKGQLSYDKKVQGARINVLPDGEILDKAYSLFCKNLIVHDQSTDDHWDVLYENIGGTYCYIYTIEKKNKSIKQKYKKVELFDKKYPILKKKVSQSLKDLEDIFAVPMYTLLKTYMRVGSEIYYKANGHKGLTTLTKKDITINGNEVTFNYIGKDGVPIKITEKFPNSYISRLKNILVSSNNKSFVFRDDNTGKPLNDIHFKEAFKKYCGVDFYPHIVRSYYATSCVKNFIQEKEIKKEIVTKEEIRDLFLEIAGKLGHKKFDKKKNEWTESYNVTVHHYIQPELVDQVKSLVSNKK
jgi:hypothetical protein